MISQTILGRRRDRADAEYKHSYNTRTNAPFRRRDLRRSINAITRAYVRRFVCAVRSAYYGVRSINPALHHIVSDIEGMLRAA